VEIAVTEDEETEEKRIYILHRDVCFFILTPYFAPLDVVSCGIFHTCLNWQLFRDATLRDGV